MIKAKIKDKPTVIDIISKSFDQNLSVNYVVKQDHKRVERIKILSDYSFFMCFNFGEILLSEDKKSCALILYPKKKKTTIQTVLWDIKLAFKCIGFSRSLSILKRETQVTKNHPTKDFSYLWFIGTLPESQGNGIGSELLANIISKYDKLKLPIYLETSTVENILWYKNFGFNIYKEMDFGYKLFMLKKLF